MLKITNIRTFVKNKAPRTNPGRGGIGELWVGLLVTAREKVDHISSIHVRFAGGWGEGYWLLGFRRASLRKGERADPREASP